MKKEILYKLRFLLPLALLLIGLYSFPVAIMENDLSAIPGDYGDARFNNYILEHGHKYITGETKEFWNAPFMYPFKNVIAFSDNLLGSMPIYSIYRTIGIDRETAFQYWIITLFALNFLTCFWVLYKLSKNTILASSAAYCFAFGIFIIGQMEHAQVFPRFIAPLVFYWLYLYVTQKNTKYFLLFLLGIVFQFYCAIYLGFILVYCLLFVSIAYIIVYQDFSVLKQFKNFKIIFTHLLLIIFALALLWPMMRQYISITEITGMRTFDEFKNTIPKPQSYFFTHIGATTWKGILSEHSKFAFDEWWSHFMFMGALPWLAILLALILLLIKNKMINKKLIGFLLLLLFLSLLFCTNFNDFTLYKLIASLPGFSSMRAIDRYINMQSFLFMLVFVFVFLELQKTFPKTTYIIALLPLLVLIDNRVNKWELKRFGKYENQQKIAEVAETLRLNYNNKSKAVAFMVSNINRNAPNFHDITIENQLTILLAAQVQHITVVNAYTGFYPNGYMDFFDNMTEQSLLNWCNVSNANQKNIQRIYAPIGNVVGIERILIKSTNEQYLTIDNSGASLIFDSDSTIENHLFLLYKLNNNKISIKATNNNFLCAEILNKQEVLPNKKVNSNWEIFEVIKLNKDTIALKASNGKYLRKTTNIESQLTAISDSIGQNEKFVFIYK